MFTLFLSWTCGVVHVARAPPHHPPCRRRARARAIRATSTSPPSGRMARRGRWTRSAGACGTAASRQERRTRTATRACRSRRRRVQLDGDPDRVHAQGDGKDVRSPTRAEEDATHARRTAANGRRLLRGRPSARSTKDSEERRPDVRGRRHRPWRSTGRRRRSRRRRRRTRSMTRRAARRCLAACRSSPTSEFGGASGRRSPAARGGGEALEKALAPRSSPGRGRAHLARRAAADQGKRR